MEECKRRKLNVLPVAFTGIASTLLEGGRTIHSTFAFGLNTNSTTVSNIVPISEEGQQFREYHVVIIDEISMVNRHIFDAIDKFFREVCDKPDVPFGGKIVIVGGDYRQTLPIVADAQTNEQVVRICANQTNVWDHFRRLELSANMRCAKKKKKNRFLQFILNYSLIGSF